MTLDPQITSNSHAGSSTLAGARNNNTRTVSHISSGSVGALSLSSFVPTQSSQTSACPTRPFLTSPSNHSPGLHRKRKNTERLNLRHPGGKKRRVDPIDESGCIYVDQLDGFEGPSLEGSTILHGLSSGNMNYQSNVQSEHPPRVGRSLSQKARPLSPTQGGSTPSSIPVKREICYAYVMSIPETPMSSSYRPNSPTTPSTSRIVPRPVHRAIDGNNMTLSITQAAPRSTPPRRQDQLVLSDLQNRPSRPPKTILKQIPKTGNPSIGFIDLCSSDDEGPMDNHDRTGGRSSRTQARDDGPLSGEESDSDYWSICLSDDHQEGPVHAPDQVSTVQPTYIQKGWIPPVSNFAMAS